METMAARVARTLEDPDALGAKWNGYDCSYHFPDGSVGHWSTWTGTEHRPMARFIVCAPLAR